MKLYEINKQIHSLLFSEEEMTDDEFQNSLGNLQNQFDSKLENCGKALLMMKSNEEAIGNEIKRLQSRKKSIEKQYNRLEEYVITNMALNQQKVLISDIFTIRIKQRDKISFHGNIDELPLSLIRTKKEANLSAIKSLIKTGEYIDGIVVDNSEYVQIK